MYTAWEEIHQQLIRAAASGVARTSYLPIRTLFRVSGRATLARAADPRALLALLDAPVTPLRRRADAIAALVVVARDREPEARLASTLLWLITWPTLDRLHTRASLVDARRTDSELASDLAAAFGAAISEAALDDPEDLEDRLMLTTTDALMAPIGRHARMATVPFSFIGARALAALMSAPFRDDAATLSEPW
jgi:hypothetical protein